MSTAAAVVKLPLSDKKPLVFKELITPWLHRKLDELEQRYGKDSPEHRALALQYVKDGREDEPMDERNAKHYEAGISFPENETGLPGLERFTPTAALHTTRGESAASSC